MMMRRAAFALFAFVALFIACGGATSTPIDNSNVGGGGGGASSSGSSTSTSSSSGSTSSGGGASSGGAGDAGATTDGGGSGSNPGFVTCGSLTCKTNGGGPSIEDLYCCIDKDGTGVCKQGPVTVCDGSRILCDERADCVDEKSVCCAETGISSGPGGGERIQTRCMPTCVTDAPRTQVCKTDAECVDAGGKCQAFNCPGYPPSLRFCSKPCKG